MLERGREAESTPTSFFFKNPKRLREGSNFGNVEDLNLCEDQLLFDKTLPSDVHAGSDVILAREWGKVHRFKTQVIM